MQVPEGLRETIEQVHGAAGLQWLAALPVLLQECRDRWSLELDPPFENLSYNLVLPGKLLDGTPIVLKLGVPCRELTTEAAALVLFQGRGTVRLLDHESTRGILLMDRLIPGTPIYESQSDREATSTAARLMKKLWLAPPAEHVFPSLSDWFLAFERLRKQFPGGSGPFPEDLIRGAESSFGELNESANASMVLHGDLHHANMLLSAEDKWLAIDPKGIIGDPAYEVGSFMLNGLPAGASDAALSEVFSRRLSIFSDELCIEKERLNRWAFCHAVLSALWDWEETKDWRQTLRLAQILERACY